LPPLHHALGLSAAPEAPAPPPTVFDMAKSQALVVGSDVVTFEKGVEAEFRAGISNAALFAQLAANHKVSPTDEPMKWFDAYFDILQHLGWTVQTRDTAQYDFKADGFEVHQAIIDVITAFLAPMPGAAALVIATLKGLQSMNKGQPFITIFKKTTENAKVSRFQFTFVHQDATDGLMAEAMAFALTDTETITQVLFFKLHKNRSSLKRSNGSLSINTDALAVIKAPMARKVAAFLPRYIADMDLTPPV